MTVSGNPEPDLPADRPAPLQRRIGDVERDQAVNYLQEHMAQGRLDREEFDERLTTALNAKTAADLDPLFGDLPEPRPAGLAPQAPFAPPPWSGASVAAVPADAPTPPPVVPAPREDGMPRGAGIAIAAIWPAAIIFSFATGFEYWWIWIAAAMATVFIRKAFGPDSDQRGIRDRDRDDGPRSLGH